MLESSDIEHFHHCRRFHCIVLIGVVLMRISERRETTDAATHLYNFTSFHLSTGGEGRVSIT
jgi:hypothetical protein